MKEMAKNWANSYLFGGNADFIEELYDKYLSDPTSINDSYRKYFDSLQQDGKSKDIAQNSLKEKFVQLTQNPRGTNIGGDISKSQASVWELIDAYRNIGVTIADLDPLQRCTKEKPRELSLEAFGLANDLEAEFYLELDMAKSVKMKLKDIIAKFDAVYCNKVSFEFEHISDLNERKWLRHYVEYKYQEYKLSNSERIQLLHKLIEADGLERYLATKYPGVKRFSLEGGDSLIPALDRMLKMSAKNGIKEVHIGMAHRGRLNTLVNIAGKSPQKIFDEFDGNYKQGDFVLSGDVKYHKGYKCNYVIETGTVKVVLAYNPSHLEAVNPVVNGKVRALQDKANDKDSIMGVLIHGDSALIGLGTNQGVLNMSKTRAYNIHGMIHLVVNNQVGFTTSDVRDTRSSRYCTDIAKMIESPIIHINADDVDSLAFVVDFAIDYRTKFKKDLMINMVCFRRHGHQETDDPTLTQPYMYYLMKQHPGTRKLFADRLIADGVVTSEYVAEMMENYRLALNKGVHVKEATMQALPWYDNFDIAPIIKAKLYEPVVSKIDAKTVTKVTSIITELPNDKFQLHATVAKVVEMRKLMGAGKRPIDFGFAEMLAYGSLLTQGISIRMSGEDSGRGTFSHRHAVWHDVGRRELTDCGYIALTKLENKSKVSLYDSVLNEECVLGFEYGYSTENLRDLVIWEAQFGDFANGGQVLIDQFIASAESKWGTLSNLVMLLPHGYDGQGPEHSSARVERYLQLCAQNNLQAVMPSTAAQMFHLLRRKALTNWIKPLVIFMSKRLLRLPEAMSVLDEFTTSEFKFIIADEMTTAKPLEVNKVIVCAGQVYYDLVKSRSELKLETKVAIIRLEQLYPFPLDILQAELSRYSKASKFVWVQEEPANQGAWRQIRDNLDSAINTTQARFTVVSRPESASPATGLMSTHNNELKQLLNDAFT